MSFLPHLIMASRGEMSSGIPQIDAQAGFISLKESIAFLKGLLQ